MSGINYICLGKSEKTRNRRYHVLSFYLKGAKPAEIFNLVSRMEGYEKYKQKDCYDDIAYLRSHPLNDLPLEMVRDFGKSFYEVKITELERKLINNESENPTIWLGIQKLILSYKMELLKLAGASVERVEHSGSVISAIQYVPAKTNDDESDPTSSADEKNDDETAITSSPD